MLATWMTALLGTFLPLGCWAHGKLAVPTPRDGKEARAGLDENNPVQLGSNAFVCRYAQPNPSITPTEIRAGEKLTLEWAMQAAHAGDCAVYISYDWDSPLRSQRYVKIANLPDCKQQNFQPVQIDVPSILPAGRAILRWDWPALHVYPKIEWFTTCADVVIESSSLATASSFDSFSIVDPPIYPENAQIGVGFRDPWNSGRDMIQPGWYMTGPACVDASVNDCALTAPGTRGYTGFGGSGSGSGPMQPTPMPSPSLPSPALTTLAPVASATVSPVVPECKVRVAQAGETLSAIAAEETSLGNPVTWQQICAMNDLLDCNVITVGQELVLPPCAHQTTRTTPAPSTSPSAPSPPPGRGLPVAHPMDSLRFIGRWYPEGTSMRHSWGTGTFIMRFRGSTRAGVVLENPSELYHVCQVDGGAQTRLAHRSGTMMLATGLSAAEEHVVQCGRSNEASYGETELRDVVLDQGALLLQAEGPAASELRYEAIGDSITAGFKVTVQPGSGQGATSENEDVFATYVRHLADAWGTAEWRVTARSGISVTSYGAERVMQEQWPCRSFSWGACPVLWDFAPWQADVVTINLGTNDYAFGSPAEADFESAYRELVQLVRGKYPSALILCIAPLQYSCSGGHAKWQSMASGVRRAVQWFESRGDERVRHHATGSPAEPWLDCAADYSDYTHPTVEGNRKFADRLLETLTADVRRFYPAKCGGSGSRCERPATEPSPRPAPVPAPGPTSAPAATAAPTPAPMTPGPAPMPTPMPTSAPAPSPAVQTTACVPETDCTLNSLCSVDWTAYCSALATANACAPPYCKQVQQQDASSVSGQRPASAVEARAPTLVRRQRLRATPLQPGVDRALIQQKATLASLDLTPWEEEEDGTPAWDWAEMPAGLSNQEL